MRIRQILGRSALWRSAFFISLATLLDGQAQDIFAQEATESELADPGDPQTPTGSPEGDLPAESNDQLDPQAQTAPTNPRIQEYFSTILKQPGGLTSDEAATGAAKISPRARAAQTRVASAKARVREVKWSYLPRLTLSAGYTKLSPQPDTGGDIQGSLVGTAAPPGPIPDGTELIALDASQAFQLITDQWSLNAGITLPISDYILNLSKALTGAKAARESAELNEHAERLNAAVNARIRYYNWVRARLDAREAKKSVERATLQLETIAAQAKAGLASRADELRSDAFLASTELDMRRARTREAVALEQLNVLVTGGEKSQPNWQIGEAIIVAPPKSWRETKSLDELQQEALSSRLEIQALRRNSDALRDKEKVERSQAYPRLEGFANAQYANPNSRIVPQVDDWLGSWDLGLRVSWTLNDLGVQYSRAAQSAADAAQVEAQVQELEFALRTEVLQEYRTLQESSLATAAAQRGFEATEAAYRDRVTLYQAGRATSLDLLEAETALVRSRLDLVAAYIGQHISRARLDHALGRDINPQYSRSSEK
ncbi:MAG: TolC family protein [Polyangiaceae bacterium]|nr:TolC family protein [Polyangiaceae bacterium]